jgi:hypothetical protein
MTENVIYAPNVIYAVARPVPSRMWLELRGAGLR